MGGGVETREHQHRWQKGDVFGTVIALNQCGCGTIICSSPSPDGKHNCNLEIGHPESCQNTFHPEAGTWREKPKDPPMKVVVTRQSDDYYAKLEGQVGVWGNGKSPYAAIGNMVNAHRKVFGLVIEHDYKVPK